MCTMRIEECLRCPHTDTCELDVFPEERDIQDRLDRELVVMEPEARRRQETLRKYNRSAKGKARAKRYQDSGKGKETLKRKVSSRIDRGKNAECCRRWYYRQKALKEARYEQADH